MGKQFFFLVLSASLLTGLADISHSGTIAGTVKFNGTLQNPSAIKATKDQDYCGVTIPNESYLIASDVTVMVGPLIPMMRVQITSVLREAASQR